jgi:hypothetical protein
MLHDLGQTHPLPARHRPDPGGVMPACRPPRHAELPVPGRFISTGT